MASINCTLSEMKITGYPGFLSDYGSKLSDGVSADGRDIMRDILLPFDRQRPFQITEDSTTSNLEADSSFVFTASGVTLSIGNATFVGCRAVVMNTSSGSCKVMCQGINFTMLAGSRVVLSYVGGWIVVEQTPGVLSQRDTFRTHRIFNSDLADGRFLQPIRSAGQRRMIVLKAGVEFSYVPSGSITDGVTRRFFTGQSDMLINAESALDTGTALIAGRSYYVFLAPSTDGFNTDVKVSLNKDAPDGLQAEDCFLIGGLDTLCVSSGSGMTFWEGDVQTSHPLNDYLAGDILPDSVWCLSCRPFSEPEGMVYIPLLDIWVDIYLMSGSGLNAKSVYHGAITRSRQYVDLVEDLFCVKKELLSDSEFACVANGSNETTSVLGASESGATSGGAGGRIDTAGRRMISKYGLEECCGSLWQWLRDTSGGPVGYSSTTTLYGENGAGTYAWNTASTSSYGPMTQSGGSAGNSKKGQLWMHVPVLIAGGSWHHGVSCGSRARNGTDARSNAHTDIGGRGRSRRAQNVNV